MANTFTATLKEYLKQRLGENYDPWIRSPYHLLLRIKRFPGYLIKRFRWHLITRFRWHLITRFTWHFINWHLIKTNQIRLNIRQRIQRAPRYLQLRVQVYRHKFPLHPLCFLACPVFTAIVRSREQRYYRYYEKFSAKTAALVAEQKKRNGLLLVSGTLAPGGSERQTVLTTLGMLRRGFKSVGIAVVYMRTEFERFYLHKLQAAGTRIIEFPHVTRGEHAGEPSYLSSVQDALPPELHDVGDYMRVLTEQQPQIVHLWLDEVNIKGGLAAVATRVPRIVLSGRNLPPDNFLLYQPYMREAYRWLLRQPGVTLINNSAAGARAYEHWLGLPVGYIAVVHNGFNFETITDEWRVKQSGLYKERWGIPQHAPVVGTVIRLNEEKRPLLWAEIAAQVARQVPDVHFIVVGDGPLRPALEARAARADLVGRFHIVGLEKQPHFVMAAMTLFLLCSRGEGLPNVLVEAQSVGVPVVTTRVGGAPETLDHGRTGWVLRSDKLGQAAGEIVRLLKDESWRRAASMAGPGFVRAHFGLERMLDETLAVYEGPNKFYATHDKGAHLERTAV